MPTSAVTNTFASQSGPIPLSQLDTNFNDVTGYLNSTFAPWITATVVPGFASTSGQQQTGTVLTTFVSPGVQAIHKSATKAWAFWSGTATGTISALSSYNVASIVKNGTGSYIVSLSTPMTHSAYPIGVGFHSNAGVFRVDIANTATFTISIFNTSFSAADMQALSFWAFGLQ